MDNLNGTRGNRRECLRTASCSFLFHFGRFFLRLSKQKPSIRLDRPPIYPNIRIGGYIVVNGGTLLVSAETVFKAMAEPTRQRELTWTAPF